MRLMKPLNTRVSDALTAMLKDGRRITTGTVAERAGVSAPTAYNALRAMVEAGKLEHVGAGRGAHFRPVQQVLSRVTAKREGLSESDIWDRFALLPAIKGLRRNVRDVMHIGLTEIVNNAIDHSLGSTVEMSLFHSDGAIAFEVKDDGIGIFESVMKKVGLKTPFEAIAELQKGKVTTMPEQHAGEGIFFTSKMADRMSIESHGIRWLIDNADTNDQSVGQVSPATNGTRVRFRIAVNSERMAESVYGAFTSGENPQAFTKTRTAIRLFREGNRIVSRSEAKRLVVGLEKFSEVELDFSGIDGIGQGFADEVFRVWQRDHADTRLIVTHANRAVRFMIARARTQVVSPEPATVRLTVGTPTVVVAPAPTVSGSGGSTFTFAASGQGRVEENESQPDDRLGN
jgi:anti-sigma regulatory factor (Ser/Thr protein kinase)